MPRWSILASKPSAPLSISTWTVWSLISLLLLKGQHVGYPIEHNQKCSCSSHCTGDSYRFARMPVLRAAGCEGVSLNLCTCCFLLLKLLSRQVKWSSWHKFMCTRRELLFTPSPGQQWELATTRTAVWGELTAPTVEGKGRKEIQCWMWDVLQQITVHFQP